MVKLAPLGSGEPALLIDKDGEVISTVDEHNDKVREDVAKTIGAQLADYEAPEEEDAEDDAGASE